MRRAYFFNAVVWGEKFRRYLCDYCIASLLAPGNIPALELDPGSRFLVACPAEDRDALLREPILERLALHVRPEFVEIPPPPPGVSSCMHMGVGHKRMAQIIAERRGCGVFVTPDLLISDGTMRTVQTRAESGTAAVLIAAYRFCDDSLLDLLAKGGHVRRGMPLMVSSRDLTRMALQSLHTETLCYEWNSSFFSDFPVACFWRVPGEEGIVLHAFSWAMLMLDYRNIPSHDTTTLDGWTIDGDYLYRNLGSHERIAFLTDSDDGMLVGFAPEPREKPYMRPSCLKNLPLVGDVVKGDILNRAFHSNVYDPIKRALFFTPVRWHAKDLHGRWAGVERRALETLLRSVTLEDEQFRAAEQVRARQCLGSQQCWRDARAVDSAVVLIREAERRMQRVDLDWTLARGRLWFLRLQRGVLVWKFLSVRFHPITLAIRIMQRWSEARPYVRLSIQLLVRYGFRLALRTTVPVLLGRGDWEEAKSWMRGAPQPNDA